MTNSEPQLLPFIQISNLRSHSARLSALPSISVMPPPCCVCLIQWPPYCPPGMIMVTWPRVVPGTGALSPHPHCSPPLAALHLHLLAPSSMPSPRSQLPHTAHYPTATHHPSKSGSIHVSPVNQCDDTPPSPAQMSAWWAQCMGSLFLCLPSHVIRAEDPSVVFSDVLNVGVQQYCNQSLILFHHAPIVAYTNFKLYHSLHFLCFCTGTLSKRII